MEITDQCKNARDGKGIQHCGETYQNQCLSCHREIVLRYIVNILRVSVEDSKQHGKKTQAMGTETYTHIYHIYLPEVLEHKDCV